MFELVEDVQLKTKEFLHPNPASRAKMSAVKGISKLSGQAKAATYPQPEGVLGDAMSTYGKKLGEDSNYGKNNTISPDKKQTFISSSLFSQLKPW